MLAGEKFFDLIRPVFGRLTQGQVEGMQAIIEYGVRWGYSIPQIAYALATAYKETAKWMQPIREGGMRFGPTYTDAAAKRAVASIHARGIIRTNYALPSGPFRQSYYGRGLIQITWYDNYKKFGDLLNIPLAEEPDRALEWPVSLDIMFLGLRDGLFRNGLGFDDFDLTDPDDVFNARDAVNGDKNRTYGGAKSIGKEIADVHFAFIRALEAGE